MGAHMGHDQSYASYVKSNGERCECMHCHEVFHIDERFTTQCPWKLEHIKPLLDKAKA